MSIKKVHKSKPLGLIFMPFLVALFADMKCENWGLVKGGFCDEGILGLLYITTVGLIFLSSLLFNTENLRNLFKYPTFLATFLVCFYFVTSNLYGTPTVPIVFFILLAPYNGTAQSSGIIAYAAHYRKPVIVPDEGLLGRLVKRYELGRADKNLTAKKLYEAYSAQCMSGEKAKEYEKDNSITNFVSSILD